MTKRLKRKLKRISIAVISVLILAILLFTSDKTGLFVMSKDKKEDLSSAEISEAVNSGIELAEDDGVIICDSIMQGVKDNNLPDGDYIFRVNGKTESGSETIDYKIELINNYNDVMYSTDSGNANKTISLGDTSKEYKMLVVKYHKNLTINKGVTVTAATSSTMVNGTNYNLCYKKGMYLCVMGELVNNGTISMTARGTYNVSGENVYLWKDKNSNFEYVPALGAEGLAAHQPKNTTGTWSEGRKGNDGANRGLGSGGQGANIFNGLGGSKDGWVGASTGGTSYAGGNGSGSVVNSNAAATPKTTGQASLNYGGSGYSYNSGNYVEWFAGGGAGIIGGNSGYYGCSTANTEAKGQNGSGGLLLLYTNDLTNNGIIESNGTNGAGANRYFTSSYRAATGGGGSGGGSINVFYKRTTNLGSIIADRWTRRKCIRLSEYESWAT